MDVLKGYETEYYPPKDYRKNKQKRKYISVAIRKQIYEKYNGHCAYCGIKMEYKEMKVDHFIPIAGTTDGIPMKNGKPIDLNSIDNYMPACYPCNHYKYSCTIEEFRGALKYLYRRVQKEFLIRLSVRYGMIKFNKSMAKFYFETLEEK